MDNQFHVPIHLCREPVKAYGEILVEDWFHCVHHNPRRKLLNKDKYLGKYGIQLLIALHKTVGWMQKNVNRREIGASIVLQVLVQEFIQHFNN